jgi:hypothetical protein
MEVDRPEQESVQAVLSHNKVHELTHYVYYRN